MPVNQDAFQYFSELWNIFTLNFPLPTSILLGLNMSTKNTCTFQGSFHLYSRTPFPSISGYPSNRSFACDTEISISALLGGWGVIRATKGCWAALTALTRSSGLRTSNSFLNTERTNQWELAKRVFITLYIEWDGCQFCTHIHRIMI